MTHSALPEIISYAEGLVLLKKYLKDDVKRIRHCEGVAKIAYDTAKKIKAKHPHLPIHPEKVQIAGLLHDIGYAREGGHHELHSVDILREEHLPEIAEIVLHSYVYELHLLEGIDDKKHLPMTLENKIVIFADLVCDHNHEIFAASERIAEIKERKKHETKRMLALEKAEARLLLIEAEILNLL